VVLYTINAQNKGLFFAEIEISWLVIAHTAKSLRDFPAFRCRQAQKRKDAKVAYAPLSK